MLPTSSLRQTTLFINRLRRLSVIHRWIPKRHTLLAAPESLHGCRVNP